MDTRTQGEGMLRGARLEGPGSRRLGWGGETDSFSEKENPWGLLVEQSLGDLGPQRDGLGCQLGSPWASGSR